MIDEEKYLDPDYQLRSTLSPTRGAGASLKIAKICYLCNEKTSKGERDTDHDIGAWICWDCKKERDVARRAIKRMENEL